MLQNYKRHPFFETWGVDKKKEFNTFANRYLLIINILGFLCGDSVSNMILPGPCWLAFWAALILGIMVWLIFLLLGFSLLIALVLVSENAQRNKATADAFHEQAK